MEAVLATAERRIGEKRLKQKDHHVSLHAAAILKLVYASAKLVGQAVLLRAQVTRRDAQGVAAVPVAALERLVRRGEDGVGEGVAARVHAQLLAVDEVLLSWHGQREQEKGKENGHIERRC